MVIQNKEKKNAGNDGIQHEDTFFRYRDSYVVIVDIEYPIYRDIMQEHPVIFTEPESIA